jgi:PAS domain S-box-containing protein
LLLFDEAKSDFRAFVHNPQDPASISVNEIWSLEQSLDGTQLIIGTRHGVSLMQLNKPGTFVNLLGNKCPDTGGPIFYYLQTLQTDTNTAWFATVNGLARLNLATRTWQCVTTDPANGRSISSNLTTVIFSDSQKRLWVGTKDGLNLMKPNGTFQRWSRKNGLASDIINGIAEDERGRLWIATSNGISELNPTTGRIRNYSQLDGLKSKEFKQGAFHQEGGFIYFGHAAGVTRFNPIQSGELKDVPSEVFITDLKIFNESVRVGEFDSLLRQNIRYTQRVKIRHDQSVVTLDFAGIHYAHPEKVQYAYQLVGADRDWVKAGTRRSVTYSHLPPDTYTFRVRVSTGNEAWNPKEATLTLEVLPPWWKTWWARTGAGVGIVLIFFGLVRYRTRQAVAQRRELAQLVKSRTLELQASRDKYENLVDNIPVGVYTVKKTVDNQYQFLYASPVFCETNGLSEEEIKKDFAASLKNIHPDDLPGFLAANQQSADTDQPFVWEGRMVVNGQTKYLHTESGPRQCLDGSTEWNGIQYEITDRKLAELELQRVYSQRQLILDNVPANIFCKDRTGKFLFVNRLMAEMYGQTPAELIAAKPRDVKHTPEQLGRYHAEDVYVLETGKPLFIPKEEFVRADGSTGIFQTIKVPLQLDEQSGSVVLGISVEITDRVKIENELARVKQILEQTNQLARVGGWEYDFRTKQVFWTEVMYDIHELPLNDHVDARSATKFIFAEEDRAMVTRSMQLLVNEREVFDHELRIRTAKGNVRWVRVFAEGQWDEMGCVRVFGAFQDIDVIKQTEAALREARLQAETASAAKSEFLASMSHEIRTPLNGVIGFTDILAKTGLTETQQHYVATVSQSAHALLDIINDILDFSKIEAGKLELAVERVDLPLLMQQAVDIVKYQAHKKGLELLLHIPANVPRFLFVDEVRLRQILVNLLSNAVKFTDQGDIELKVVLREADLQRGNRLTFSVRDTGIGIKASNQHKIFEEFAQEDNSTTKRFGGTGLGLAISNRLLALMGSRLGLSSVPGHGSTFWFDVWMESESVAAQVEEFGNQRQVLVIDNHPTARQILTELVTDVGIKVREAASGPEAVALFQAGTRFDAILIDYHMPGMDGITTIQKIRSLPGVPHVPVILFYSSADSEFIDDLCDQMGIRFRVMKPALRQPVYTLLANAWREAIPEQAVRVQPTIHSTTEKAIRILVAEDNPVNLLLVKSMLESAYPHAEVVEALNGKEAVSQFQRCNPNIVFMDVRMPDVSGFEATRMIRTWEAGRTRVPIVALTAGTAQADREKALEAGMDDYLSKPVVQSVFLNTLRKWLGKSEKPTVARVPPFDLSDLRARLGFSDAALQQLVRVALASATETVIEIEKCWKNSRVDGWQEAAHKLKGVAMNAAFLQLAQLASEMEEIEPRAVDRYLMEQKLRDMRAALTSLHTQVANAFARP